MAEHNASDDLSITVGYDYFPSNKGELDLQYLGRFPNVSSLHLRYVAGLQSLEILSGLKKLRHLSVGPTKTQMLSLKPLSHCERLQSLTLDKQCRDIEIVGELKNLEKLSLCSVRLPSMDFLSAAESLSSLRIALGGTTNLNVLPKLCLRHFEVWEVRGISDEDLSPLSDSVHLESLFLDRLKHVSTLPSLKSLNKLSKIELNGLSNLQSLSAILEAPSLVELVVTGDSVHQPEFFLPLRELSKKVSIRIGLGSDKRNRRVEELLRAED